MLKEKLQNDLKAAMKSRESNTVSVIRMLQAAIKNKEIEKKDELTDAEVVKLLQGEKKKHLDSISQFETGGRADLVGKEKSEVAVIEQYLPAAMPEEELQKIVETAAAAAGGDFGRAMGAAMAKAAGRADGARVSELVKKTLTENKT